MTLEIALGRLEEKASREHYPEITIKNYQSKLRKLAEYFRDTAIEDITLSQIQEFLNIRVKRDKVSYHTIQVDRYALEYFYNRVLSRNYDFDSINNPAKQQKSTPELFTKEEITKLLETAETLRDRLIFAFMYHFEMDRGEIIGLQVKSIERQKDGVMALKSILREHSEKLPISLSNELRDYLAISKPTRWLFEFIKGKQPSGEHVHRAFKKTLMLAGIHKRLSTKSLGDSHAEHARQFSVVLIDEMLTSNTRKTPDNFVDPRQIDELKQIQSEIFDLRKLIRLCEELNGCYTHEWFFAASILQRAILDHIPPIFDCKNFSEVVNNYSGGRSFKTQMEHLQNFARTTADNAVHGMIRDREVLISQTQVDFRSAISTLLAEVLRKLR